MYLWWERVEHTSWLYTWCVMFVIVCVYALTHNSNCSPAFSFRDAFCWSLSLSFTLLNVRVETKERFCCPFFLPCFLPHSLRQPLPHFFFLSFFLLHSPSNCFSLFKFFFHGCNTFYGFPGVLPVKSQISAIFFLETTVNSMSRKNGNMWKTIGLVTACSVCHWVENICWLCNWRFCCCKNEQHNLYS